LLIGLLTSGVLVALAITHLDVLFFIRILDASEEVARVAHAAFFAAAALPLVGAMQSYIRGMLTAHHMTVQRFTAVIVAMVSLAIALGLTVVLGYAGVVSAGIAMTLALVAELLVLMAAFRRRPLPAG
jgi:Na+-driven multidrug efflux pump